MIVKLTQVFFTLVLTPFLLSAGIAHAQSDKPNILVIMGDDVGITNISAYSHGLMGYQTPNIDQLAEEGAMFTDYYGEQSCTAGRSAFITGQSPFRVGLTKVGMPGAKQGISDKDPTLAQLLKPHGYTSGQFGKNHLGDRNEYLPTVHGFDEYAGVLYHLNALEEPENVDYPKDPEFFKNFGPRNVIYTWATDKADKTEDPRFGVVGKQKIKDLGKMTIERMKTYDDETLAQSIDFMKRAIQDKKPFFVWHNTTRTHAFTHLREKYADMIPEKGFMGAAMTELDDTVGALLKALEDLGVADNTIVVFTSDNGAMKFSWPDAGTSPFQGEKATTWEGGVRVPAMVRWPDTVKPGTVDTAMTWGMEKLPFLAQPEKIAGDIRGQLGVAKHDRHDRVRAFLNVKPGLRNLAAEVRGVVFEFVTKLGRLFEEVDDFEPRHHDRRRQQQRHHRPLRQ